MTGDTCMDCPDMPARNMDPPELPRVREPSVGDVCEAMRWAIDLKEYHKKGAIAKWPHRRAIFDLVNECYANVANEMEQMPWEDWP